MTDYRKYYAEYYRITWDAKEFEVHHIDRNRENNFIDNLILLPKDLHKRLHKVYNDIDRMKAYCQSTNRDVIGLREQENINYHGHSLSINYLEEFIAVLEECHNWGALKGVNYCHPWGDSIGIITLNTRFI